MTENGAYVFDPESATELTRLINQDRFTTKAMGGVFAGLSDNEIEKIETVLDVACGSGGWVLDVAFAYPDIEVAGVDISQMMIDYALASTRAQGLTNASFEVMDVTTHLEFDDASFDLVNARFLFAVLKRQGWRPFLEECIRIVRPGGIVRLTEPIDMGVTNSAAHREYVRLFVAALWRVGYGLSPDEYTLDSTFRLPHLLREYGLQDVQYRPVAIDVSGESENWNDHYRNYQVAYAAAKPLLVATGVASQEKVDQLYNQVMVDMLRNDFSGMGYIATVWGRRPLS